MLDLEIAPGLGQQTLLRMRAQSREIATLEIDERLLSDERIERWPKECLCCTEDSCERINRAFETQLTPVAGIEEALAQIAIPVCVASNGPLDKMRLTLGLTGLLPRFEGRLFSSKDVARAKPAPDVFLHAASHCSVAPADCVVVEDTPTGVAAAKAAGMTVLAYAALTPGHRLLAAGAHHVFDRMADLPGMLCSGRA